MKKDTVIREYVLLGELQVKQERVCKWTCACASTVRKGSSQTEKEKKGD